MSFIPFILKKCTNADIFHSFMNIILFSIYSCLQFDVEWNIPQSKLVLRHLCNSSSKPLNPSILFFLWFSDFILLFFTYTNVRRKLRRVIRATFSGALCLAASRIKGTLTHATESAVCMAERGGGSSSGGERGMEMCGFQST